MAQEHNLIPDYSPVDPEEIAVYPVAPRTTVAESAPVSVLEFEGVTAGWHIEGFGHDRDFEVTVEYQSVFAADEVAFRSYLDTFEEARISQESMAQLIRKHLRDALDTDDIFVEVSNDKKRTRLGKIDNHE